MLVSWCGFFIINIYLCYLLHPIQSVKSSAMFWQAQHCGSFCTSLAFPLVGISSSGTLTYSVLPKIGCLPTGWCSWRFLQSLFQAFPIQGAVSNYRLDSWPDLSCGWFNQAVKPAPATMLWAAMPGLWLASRRCSPTALVIYMQSGTYGLYCILLLAFIYFCLPVEWWISVFPVPGMLCSPIP